VAPYFVKCTQSVSVNIENIWNVFHVTNQTAWEIKYMNENLSTIYTSVSIRKAIFV
jgi:hypothetical protein